MQRKIFYLFVIVLLFLLGFLLATDSQFYQSCGGDIQATIGCMGDSQMSFSGAEASSPQDLPTLEIKKPKNQTYINGNGMMIEIETNSGDVWYHLDNGQNNTIPPSKKAPFNTDEGTHIVYVYANNSGGITARNVTFTINSTRFQMNNTEYTGSNRGETTNFSEYSYEEMQDLSNVTLEKSGKGKIKFIQSINFTDDFNPGDGIVDLDSYIIISNNRIEINTSALPNFNKTATLSLYDLTFINPQILMDGLPCPSSICTKGSYSGGTLEFNVTHFTTYTIQETPESSSEGPASGGGDSRECHDNADCSKPGYGICWNYECITHLFDVKILEFESPVKLGSFFSFTYSLKDMANVNNDVDVEFWIEKDGLNITSGSDVVFVGGLKEITETGKLFIPENIKSGEYIFYIQISNNAEATKVHRTIQISVDKGIVTIVPVPDGPSKGIMILIFSLVIIILIMLFYIIYSNKKRKINWLQKMIKKIYSNLVQTTSKPKASRNKAKPRPEKESVPVSVQEIAAEKSHQQEKPKILEPKTAQEIVEEIKDAVGNEVQKKL